MSKPPPAKPFFNQSSLVIDFYKGHLSAMVDRVADSDYSFIMYYAPWDAESQAARQQFEIAAQYYQNEVNNKFFTFFQKVIILFSNFFPLSPGLFCRNKLLASRIRVQDTVQQDPQFPSSHALSVERSWCAVQRNSQCSLYHTFHRCRDESSFPHYEQESVGAAID